MTIKINRKFLCILLMCVLVIGIAGSVSAAVAQRDAKLTYKNISIQINGSKITPKDVTGKAVEPFIIDGTTYLPVRAVGEAVGYEVDWDNATSTVTMNNALSTDEISLWHRLAGHAREVRELSNMAAQTGMLAMNSDSWNKSIVQDLNNDIINDTATLESNVSTLQNYISYFGDETVKKEAGNLAEKLMVAISYIKAANAANAALIDYAGLGLNTSENYQNAVDILIDSQNTAYQYATDAISTSEANFSAALK